MFQNMISQNMRKVIVVVHCLGSASPGIPAVRFAARRPDGKRLATLKVQGLLPQLGYNCSGSSCSANPLASPVCLSESQLINKFHLHFYYYIIIIYLPCWLQDLTSLLFSEGVLRADELSLRDEGRSLIDPPPLLLLFIEDKIPWLVVKFIFSNVPFSR